MAKPKRVGHRVLNVKDLAASTQFYTEMLGFQISRQRETGTFLTCGKIHHDVALFQAPADALPVTSGQLGLNHFAVQVENLADLKAARRVSGQGRPLGPQHRPRDDLQHIFL